MHCRDFYTKAQGYSAQAQEPSKRQRIYKICDSLVHAYKCFRLYKQYNLVLLFVIYSFLYDDLKNT